MAYGGAVKERWDLDGFRWICSLAKYWSVNEFSQDFKQKASKLFSSLITYSVVHRNSECEEDSYVMIRLWPNEYGYLQVIIGRAQVGLPEDKNLDLGIDYVGQAEEETEKWKVERAAQREANLKWEAEERQRKRDEKEKVKIEAEQRDCQLIRDYLSSHDIVNVVKAQMARELDIPYARCLKLCKQITGEK